MKIYLPFWILLEYLGKTPSEAFIPCYIISEETRSLGNTSALFYTLAIYKPDSDLKAYNVPAQFVIQEEDLAEWGLKIGKWFAEAGTQMECKIIPQNKVPELANRLVNEICTNTRPKMLKINSSQLAQHIIEEALSQWT